MRPARRNPPRRAQARYAGGRVSANLLTRGVCHARRQQPYLLPDASGAPLNVPAPTSEAEGTHAGGYLLRNASGGRATTRGINYAELEENANTPRAGRNAHSAGSSGRSERSNGSSLKQSVREQNRCGPRSCAGSWWSLCEASCETPEGCWRG